MGCSNGKSQIQSSPAPGPDPNGQRKKRGKRDSIAYNKGAMKRREDHADGSERAPESMVEVVKT